EPPGEAQQGQRERSEHGILRRCVSPAGQRRLEEQIGGHSGTGAVSCPARCRVLRSIGSGGEPRSGGPVAARVDEETLNERHAGGGWGTCREGRSLGAVSLDAAE